MMKMKCHHNGARFIETELGRYYFCDICGERFVSWKRKIHNLWTAQRFFQGQGIIYTSWINGLFACFTAGGVTFLLIQSVTGKLPAIWILPIIWLLQTAGETWIGIKAYKLKMAQREGLYGFRHSPKAIEDTKRLRNIEKVLCEHLHKEYQKDSIVDLLK